MKIKEVISEVFLTKSPSKYSGGPSSSAHRISAPSIEFNAGGRDAPGFVKAAMHQSQQRKKDFNELSTGKEKFDFIYFLKTGKTSHSVKVSQTPDNIRNSLKIQDYDKDTGEITLTKSSSSGYITVYKGNTNNFEFIKRQRPVSSSQYSYIFTPGKIEEVDSYNSDKPRLKTGPNKKKWDIPNSPW